MKITFSGEWHRRKSLISEGGFLLHIDHQPPAPTVVCSMGERTVVIRRPRMRCEQSCIRSTSPRWEGGPCGDDDGDDG